MPERASRSASRSARSGSRKAVGAIRLTPWNRARPPFWKRQLPVLRRPRSPSARRAREQEREVEGRPRGDRRRGRHLEPVVGVVGGVERHPRGHLGVGRRGDRHVIDPDLAAGVGLLELEDRPPGPGGTRTSAASLRQSKLPAQSKRSSTSVAGIGRPRSSRKKNPAAAPPLPRRSWPRRRARARAPPGPPPAAPGRSATRESDRPSSTAAAGAVPGEDPVGVVVHDPVGRCGVAQLEVAVDDQVRGRRPPPPGPGRRSGRRCRGSPWPPAGRPT